MSLAVSRLPRLARVLFADGDSCIRDAVARTLRQRGMLVDLAADGAEALALADELPYAVVLTDYQMPGVFGVDLILALQTRQPDAALVVLTTAKHEAQPLGRMTGVHAVILKPWTEDRLLEIVEAGVHNAQQRRVTRPPSSAPFIAAGGQFVLLVEDNELDALVLQQSIALAALGEFRVVHARNLAEARRFLQSRTYSVIIADLGLPDANGLTALTGLLGASPGTPIVVVTGGDDTSLGTEAVRAGAQDYLLKGSYQPEVVVRAIRYAVERKHIETRLSELAHYDALTGLANRALMTERQKRAIARAARSRHHVALIAVDLDQFKAVNDRYGHDVGDGLLVQVAQRLLASTRSEDTVARIGGDEFVVLLEDLDGSDGARRVGQRIQNAFATPIIVDGNRLASTSSIGIALFPDDAADLGELQRHADAALYEAKHAGRNGYRFFSRELQDRARHRRELEADLEGALEAGQFHLAYLPEMEMQSGLVRGYEALLRWNRTPGSALSAREFLHVLEESGTLIRVGAWVIRQVAADAALLPLASRVRLSVNVSAGELAHPSFLGVVEEALRTNGIEGEWLEIELTEGCLATHFAAARTKLPRLAALGVAIAVDGYGAGHSSLLELAELPIHSLKLHESFLAEIGAGSQHLALAAIIGVAKGLGWSVVAKCVETSAQLELVQRLGCHRAQGRFWGTTVRSSGLLVPVDRPSNPMAATP